MAETLTLEVALGQHWFGVDPRTHESTCTCGWQGPMRLGNPLGRQSDQKAHLADAVRAWLLGQREAVAAEVFAGKVREVESAETADAVLGALTKADQ